MNSLRVGHKTQLRIETLVPGGDGLARHEGRLVFIARTAPGDIVEVEIFDVRKDFARGRISKLIQLSDQRVEPLCKLFKVCGGCQWQHMYYETQLKYKQEIVRQAVRRVNSIAPDTVLPTVGAEEPFYYRNKVQFPVKNPAGSKRLLAGYYEQDSHELVNIKHCPVQPQAFDELLGQVKELAETHGIVAYNERTQTGVLRHICIRAGACGQLLLTLVVNMKSRRSMPHPRRQQQAAPPKLQQEDALIGLRALARELTSNNPQLAGVCLNFNAKPGNRIYGEETRVLEGNGFLNERLASHSTHAPAQLRKGLTFKVSATSFFQIHREQTEKMLDIILEAVLGGAPPVVPPPIAADTLLSAWVQSHTPSANTLSSKKQSLKKPPHMLSPAVQTYTSSTNTLSSKERLLEESLQRAFPIIIDAYAGVGTIALWLACAASRIIAIEESSSAASDAEENIKLNNTTNIDFHHGKVEEILPQLSAQGIKPDVVVLDPPRKGVSKTVIEHVLKLQPKRIIYVSCNPATLARDLNELCKAGEYKTISIQPIDMFPQTFHIESISILERAD